MGMKCRPGRRIGLGVYHSLYNSIGAGDGFDPGDLATHDLSAISKAHPGFPALRLEAFGEEPRAALEIEPVMAVPAALEAEVAQQHQQQQSAASLRAKSKEHVELLHASKQARLVAHQAQQKREQQLNAMRRRDDAEVRTALREHTKLYPAAPEPTKSAPISPQHGPAAPVRGLRAGGRRARLARPASAASAASSTSRVTSAVGDTVAAVQHVLAPWPTTLTYPATYMREVDEISPSSSPQTIVMTPDGPVQPEPPAPSFSTPRAGDPVTLIQRNLTRYGAARSEWMHRHTAWHAKRVADLEEAAAREARLAEQLVHPEFDGVPQDWRGPLRDFCRQRPVHQAGIRTADLEAAGLPDPMILFAKHAAAVAERAGLPVGSAAASAEQSTPPGPTAALSHAGGASAASQHDAPHFFSQWPVSRPLHHTRVLRVGTTHDQQAADVWNNTQAELLAIRAAQRQDLQDQQCDDIALAQQRGMQPSPSNGEWDSFVQLAPAASLALLHAEPGSLRQYAQHESWLAAFNAIAADVSAQTGGDAVVAMSAGPTLPAVIAAAKSVEVLGPATASPRAAATRLHGSRRLRRNVMDDAEIDSCLAQAHALAAARAAEHELASLQSANAEESGAKREAWHASIKYCHWVEEQLQQAVRKQGSQAEQALAATGAIRFGARPTSSVAASMQSRQAHAAKSSAPSVESLAAAAVGAARHSQDVRARQAHQQRMKADFASRMHAAARDAVADKLLQLGRERARVRTSAACFQSE